MPESAKYNARKPKMAKMFDVIIMNSSLVMAITAGIESTAKTISEDSMSNKVKNRDVAKILPFFLVKNLIP